MPFLVDSSVACGASATGRSSPSHLNRILQGTLPYLLVTGIYPLFLWIASALNHADNGTRFRRLRPRIPRSVFVSEAFNQSWQQCSRARRFTSTGGAGGHEGHGLFLDVFSGISSPLSCAFRQLGWWSIALDTRIGGQHHNLSDSSVVDRIVQLVGRAGVSAIHLAPPCSTFSSWMRLCP